MSKLGEKTLTEFQQQVEECRILHDLEAYNTPKPITGSGAITPLDGWALPRFNGASSKWLRLTGQDRAIVTSLAQLANEDLSVHLYNVHSLQHKVSMSKDVASEAGQRNIVWPPRAWTKWPMKPEDVPRRQFKQIVESDDDEDISRSLQTSRGAAEDLQEIIVATFLKQAKERFHRRTANVQSLSPGSTLLAGKTTDGSSADTDSESSDTENASPAPWSSPPTQPQEKERMDDGAHGPNRKLRNSSSARISTKRPSQGQQPVPMADDDEATTLLAPIARHVLSSIDKLLTGLHHQRQAYITTTIIDSDTTADDTETDDDSSDTSSSPVPASPSKRLRHDSSSLPQSPTKRLKPTRLHSSSRRLSRTASQSSLRSSTSTESQRKRTSRLGPRDWGDIMGIASLAGGFPQHVIERASVRCASLFGEGVSFRTLGTERSRQGDGETDILPDEIRESMVSEKQSKIIKPKSIERLRPRVGGLFCQVKWCKRHTQGFSRVWNLNKHMKEIHGIPTPKEMELAAQSEQEKSAASGSNGTILDDYEAGDSDDLIEDGVHVDGYLQEIRGRPGWSRYWSKTRPRGGHSKDRRKSGSRSGKGRKDGPDLQLDGAGETVESDEYSIEEESAEDDQHHSSPSSD